LLVNRYASGFTRRHPCTDRPKGRFRAGWRWWKPVESWNCQHYTGVGLLRKVEAKSGSRAPW